MLKFFGLKEIFYGIKRFAVILIAVTVLFAGFGFITNSSQEFIDASLQYSSSKSYIVTALAETDLENQSVNDRACAETVAEMIKSDFSRAYVLEKLLTIYTPEQIAEYTGASYNGGDLNNTILQNCIDVAVLGNTAIVNFFTTVGDKEFSEALIECFDEYFNNTIVKKVTNIKEVTYAGGTTSVIEGFDSSSSGGTSRVFSMIIFGFVGFVLCVLVIMAYVLFKPSISSKEDFIGYGYTVIDDVKNHGKSGLSFASDAVVNAFQKSDSDEITLVSSLDDKSIVSYTSAISGKISDDVVCAFGINKNFDELTKIKNKNKVVLIERKGRTFHQEFCNTVDTLNLYNVEIIGVLLV